MHSKLLHTKRGTALIQVLILMVVAVGVVGLVLVASGTLKNQSTQTAEQTQVRHELRAGFQLTASYLDFQLSGADTVDGRVQSPDKDDTHAVWAKSPADPGSEPGFDTGSSYLVLKGDGLETKLDNVDKRYYAPGSPGSIKNFATDATGGAKDLLRTDPNATFVARLRYVADDSKNFHYVVRVLAKRQDASGASSQRSMILTAQTVMIPKRPNPFQYGFSGRTGVKINGGGTINDSGTSTTDPILSSNGTIE